MEMESLNFWKKRYLNDKQLLLYDFLLRHKKNINMSMCDKEKVGIDVGYEVLGPIISGYVYWLNSIIRKGQYKKILFASREGEFIKRVYEIVYGKDNLEYIYLSRIAVSNAQLFFAQNFDDIIRTIYFLLREPTFAELCNACNLNIKEFNKMLSNIGKSSNDKLYSIDDASKKEVYDYVMKEKKKFFEEQLNYLTEYLNQLNVTENVLFCDIGWQGTMQYCLQTIADRCDLNIRFEGAYLGVRIIDSDKYPSIKKDGYLFNAHDNRKYDLMLRFTTEIIEMMFMNDQGSVLKYCNNDGTVRPILAEIEYGLDELRYIRSVQEGATYFATAWMTSKTKIELSPDDVMVGYINFAIRPSMKIVKMYNDFFMFDGKKRRLIPDHNIWYYLVHPRRFISDLTVSTKIFTLKNIFIIPLPYFELADFFINKMKMRSEYRKKVTEL